MIAPHRDNADIIARAADLIGNQDRAMIWFHNEPLPGFDGKTAEVLVGEEQAKAVGAYLAGLEDGNYA